MNKPNLLIPTPIYPPIIGGPATYSHEIATRLKDKFNIKIIAFAEEAIPIKGVKIIPLKIHYKFLGFFRRQLSLLASLTRNIKWADFVYIQGPIVVGVASVIICKIYKKPHALKYVGDIAWEKAFGEGKTKKLLNDFLAKPDAGFRIKVLLKIQKWVFKNAKKLIVPSYYLKEVLEKYYNIQEEKIQVIFNAVDLKKYKEFENRAKKPKTSSQINIVTIGRLVKWKNIEGIIEAIALLSKNNKQKTANQSQKTLPPLHLKIIGEGPLQNKLQKLAASLNITNQIHFLGRKKHDDVLQELNKADLFILNSFYEGLPHVIIEAMLCNCPVI
ncbi:glycosyltransferase family 4 protein, partial [Patescibacteria group bacterium]|nr:glycosyltransferase family 4 protein [Patescibacteria group bacterium]